MPAVSLRRGAIAVAAWRPEERDAGLYAASALFAVVTIFASNIAIYRQWAEIALGPYMFAAVASGVVALFARRRGRRDNAQLRTDGTNGTSSASPPDATSDTDARPRRPRRWAVPRAAIFIVVLAGATLIPLGLEVSWRSNTPCTAHAQPEVCVVEHSGQRLAKGQDPYQLIPPARGSGAHGHHGGGGSVPRGEPSYDIYNPYGPFMAVLGLLASTHAPRGLSDARVTFSFVTLLLAALALALCRGSAGPRRLALQALTVLPTAALPLATGGDDLPVAAVLLLGVVLLRRRQAFVAGLVFGVAAGLKFTAWPLVALSLLVARDKAGDRRAGVLRTLAGIAIVLLPGSLPDVVHSPRAFVQNVILYPLGLGNIGSPAASPLPGHLIVSTWPGVNRLYAILLGITGVLAVAAVLRWRPPRTLSGALWIVGWFMFAGVMLAPATRVGYLLYPIDFLIWSWLMRSEDEHELNEEASRVVAGGRAVPAAQRGG